MEDDTGSVSAIWPFEASMYLLETSALAGVAQWIECQPENRRIASSIPSQGTHLGCRPGPQLGAHERQPHIDVSLPLSSSLPLSLEINN